jgi:hypothetical protein
MRRLYNSIELRWQDAVWWGIAFGMLIGRSATGSVGAEWHTYYRAVFKGFQNVPEVANPAYTAVLLSPLTLFPVELGADLFTLVNIVAVALACKFVAGNRWGALLSFPFGWLVWYGQIDGLVALGVGLGYRAVQEKRPYRVGIACLLLGIKPQVGGVLAVYYLWRIKDIRSFFYPVVVIAASFFLFGFWPKDYLLRFTMSSNPSFFVSQVSNIGLFPWGLLSWAVFLFGPYSLKRRVILILGATMLSSPYTAYYSTLSLIIFFLPWWGYVFFFAPFILPSYLDAMVVSLGVVLLVVYPIILRLGGKTWVEE